MFYICHGTYLLFQNYGEFLSKGLDDKNNERCKGKKIEKDLLRSEENDILVKRCMSEEVNQEEGKSREEMTQEELRELIKKVLEKGDFEAQFILTLSQWRRPGPSFEDYGKFEVLYGDVEVFQLHDYYEYPTTDETLYGIIPKSKAVVILYEWGNDYQGKLQKYAKLYIFSFHGGWKSIDLY